MAASREPLRLPWQSAQDPSKPVTAALSVGAERSSKGRAVTYKPPRLSELWSYAFQGAPQPQAHNSEGDALATAAIYMKLWGY